MINMTTEEFKTALYALVDDEHTVITNSAISDGISLIDGKINIHNVKITSEHFIFGDGSNKTRLITYADLTGVDVSSVTDLSSCFNDYGGLSLGLDISNWNTSNVTNMAYMFFRYCGTSLDLSELDTSNVISMSSMFDGCTANVLNLSSFDTSSVTDTTDMFRGCTTTRIVVDVDKWTLDTSSGVFYNYNGKVYIGDTEIMTKANSDRDIATSLNSALAEYDNNVIKANYYDKTDIDNKYGTTVYYDLTNYPTNYGYITNGSFFSFNKITKVFELNFTIEYNYSGGGTNHYFFTLPDEIQPYITKEYYQMTDKSMSNGNGFWVRIKTDKKVYWGGNGGVEGYPSAFIKLLLV